MNIFGRNKFHLMDKNEAQIQNKMDTGANSYNTYIKLEQFVVRLILFIFDYHHIFVAPAQYEWKASK